MSLYLTRNSLFNRDLGQPWPGHFRLELSSPRRVNKNEFNPPPSPPPPPMITVYICNFFVKYDFMDTENNVMVKDIL